MQEEPFIRFIVPGYIQPKQRPRFSGHAYTARKTMVYEREIAVLASLEMGGHELLECPVRLLVVASYPEPDKWPKSLRGTLIGKPYTGKTDWDNIGKVASDALQGIVYKDDRQVTDGRAIKIYGDKRQLEISIWKA